ncbi:MAG: DUF3267 domain-containing protein [Ruminococcaceae bacterium]|nr:DUF3267 domain-containing protein [Oscillospiraceae bacterium]
MKAVNVLPEGYREIYSIDLQKNKKMSVKVNLLAVVIAVAMIVPMAFIVPIYIAFDFGDGDLAYFARLAALFGLMAVYMVLHELVHGIAMKICGTKKVKYGFTGLYAFAGSDDYYDKKAYIFIALAPVVLWGIVLSVLLFVVDLEWFWIVYFIQIIMV